MTFIQTVHPHAPDLIRKYHVQEAKDFFPGNLSFLNPDALHVRTERQSFRKLPQSGAIVMTTRVQVVPLVRMSAAKLQRLAREIRGWEDHVARMKGRDLWGRAVLGFCEGRPMSRDDETVVDGESDDGGLCH